MFLTKGGMPVSPKPRLYTFLLKALAGWLTTDPTFSAENLRCRFEENVHFPQNSVVDLRTGS